MKRREGCQGIDFSKRIHYDYRKHYQGYLTSPDWALTSIILIEQTEDEKCTGQDMQLVMPRRIRRKKARARPSVTHERIDPFPPYKTIEVFRQARAVQNSWVT